MNEQLDISEFQLGASALSRNTQRQRYFKRLNELVPFDEIQKLIAPHYFLSGRRGRQPTPLKTMIRIHIVQISYNLSDPAMEDLLLENLVVREFVGLSWDDKAPDETTILHFRHLLERHNLGEKIFNLINEQLTRKGLILKRGSAVDATFIESPHSTKNKDKKRDPEMGQGRKGNVWHQGMKAHIAADIDSGVVTKVATGPANEHDVTRMADVLNGEEPSIYADSGYLGAHKRDEIKELGLTEDRFEVAQRPSILKRQAGQEEQKLTELRKIEHEKSSVRCKVEWCFKRLKQEFGYAKTRYRGLKKNTNRVLTVFAVANLLIADCYFRRTQASVCL